MFYFDRTVWAPDTAIKLKSFRWAAVIIYGLAVMCTSTISFSWQQYSLILMEGDAYNWLCSAQEIADRVRFKGAACLAQEKAVGDLFSILTTCQALSGLLGGVTIDHFGHRWCAAIGCAVAALSVILLIVAGPRFHAGYTLALIFDGLSCNMIAFPALVLADLFLGHPVAATAFVLTSEFLGAAVTPVLWAMWQANPKWAFENLWLIYLLAVMLPLSALYVYFLPPTTFVKRRAAEELERISLNVKIGSPTQQPTSAGSVSVVTNDLAHEEDEPTPSIALLDKRLSPAEAHRRLNTGGDDSALSRVRDESRTLIAKTESAKSLEIDPSAPLSRRSRFKNQMLGLWSDLCTLDFLCFEVIFNIFMLKHTFYPSVLRDMSGIDISNYQGLFQISQFFWALALGFVCDFCCTGSAMLGMSIADGVVFLLTMVPNKGLQYAVTSGFTVVHSYVYAVRFTFVRETFLKQRGQILGIIGCGSAITTLLNIPINRTTKYKLWLSIFAGLCVVQWPFIYVLKRRYNRFFRIRCPPKQITCFI